MSASRFAEQLDRQAESLVELLGDEGVHYPPALAIAAAHTVGLLRAAAAQWRDEHPDDSDGPSFGSSYLDETVLRVTNAYRDGHRDGWLSCVGAMGIAPDDPDDPGTYEDAAQLSIPIGSQPGPLGISTAPDTDLRRLLRQTTPGSPGRTGG